MSNGNGVQQNLSKLRNQTQRQDVIIEHVINVGSAKIEDLSALLNVSAMTVHRDLDDLDARGIVRKSRGIVTAVATSLFEANPEYRQRQQVQEKKAIAQSAFELVESGQAIILDDSTTGVHLAELLPQKQPLTVITHFQKTINVLIPHPTISLISLGGQHSQWSNAFMGSLTINSLKSLRADVLFMSTPAVIDDYCFHQHNEAALIKEAMFESASKRYLLVDNSKFKETALHRNIALKDFDAVIVDPGLNTETITHLKNLGVNVVVAG